MTLRTPLTGVTRAVGRASGRFTDGQADATALRAGAALAVGVLALGVTVLGGDWRVLSFGLAGLAVIDDDAIEGLTAQIAAFREGEDVDFDADRDDEVGDLYEAVGALADDVREYERRDEQGEQYRRRLYELTADPDLTDEQKVDRLLELGCERLGVDCGYVTNIDETRERYEVERVAGEDCGEVGTVLDLSKPFCHLTVQSDGILGIHDPVAAGYEDHPSYAELGIGCYVGGKVLVDDDLYGTVCFFSDGPRERPFTHDEKAFVDLVSRWIAHVVERREYTERLRLVERAMDAAPVGVSVADVTGDDCPLVSVNEAFEELTGYEESEVVGRNCRFLQGENTDAEQVARFREAIENEESITVELRNYRKDGTEFWNRVSIAPVETADGEVTHYVGFQEDVTERKERERELRRQGSLLDTIFEQAPVNLYVKDEEGRHVRTSTPYMRERYADVDEEWFVGKTDPEIYADELAEETHADDMRVIEEGETVEEKLESNPDHDEWIITSKVPWREDGEIRGLIGVSQYVTEQMEQDRRLQAIVENTTESIFIKDRDGVYQFVNEAAADLFGLAPDEMVGRRDEDLFDPAALDDIREGDRRVLENGETVSAETQTVIDGEERVFLDNKYPYEDESGETVGIMGISRDITERKERERDLRETNERLNAVIEASPDAIIALDLDGTVELWNPAAERIFGWASEEAVGEPLPIMPDDVDRGLSYFLDRVEAGEAISGAEVRRQRKDGSLIDVNLSAAPLRDESGAVVGIMGVLEDITERVEQERRLRERERELSTVIENVPGMVYRAVNEPEWPFEFASDGCRELLGYDPEAIVDGEVNWAEDVLRADNEAVWEQVQQALDAREPFQLTYEIETADGERKWAWERGRGVFEDGELQALEGVIIDVTERKEYERRLQQTRDMLEQSQRLANVGAWEFDVVDGEPVDQTWTDEVYRIHGLPTDAEIEVADGIEFYHPDDRESVRRDVQRAIEDGDPYEFEARLVTAADEVRWVRSIGDPVVVDGEVVAVRGSIQDVTERKRYERELQARERELAEYKEFTDDILDAIDDVFYILEGDGSFRRWNESVVSVTGYDDDEIDEMSGIEMFPESEYETVQRGIAEVLEAGRARVDAPIQTRDGEEIAYEFVASQVEDPDGETTLAGIGRDVSERKARERELAEYRQFTDDILDAIDDVFYLVGSDGELRRWNETLAEVTGYDDDEIQEMTGIELFPESDRAAVRAGIREAFETGRAVVEAPLLTKSGETISYEFAATTVTDPEGRTCLAGIGRDVSARKARERKLETRSAAIEAATDGIAILDEDSEYVFVNQAHAAVYGYDDPAAFIGETWEMCYDDAEIERLGSEVLPALAAEGQWRGEATGRRKDGSTFPQEITLTALADGGMVCVVRDVTERKAREAELRRTKDLLQQAGEVAAIGGWEVDLTTAPPEMTWTDELYRLHDLSPDADIDLESAVEFYHPEDQPRIRELFDEAVTSGADYDMEVRLETAGGASRWVRAIGNPVREDGEVVAIRGSIQDVTAQKERELALQTLHETTRGLLATETERAVAELVVESAAAVLETDGVGLYLLDEAANRLEPTAQTDRFATLCASVSPVAAGEAESVTWETFVTGTAQILDAEDVSSTELFDEDCESAMLVPVGDHGVLVVALASGAVDDRTRQLTETLVATTEAALDRLESEASLRERDEELEAQNRRLKRQIQVTDIIRRIDQSLIRAGSRAEIEEAVCSGLADAEDVALAWIGGVTPSGDRVEPRAWAGTGDEYLDAVSLSTDEASLEPAVATATGGEATVVSNVVEGLKREPWRKQALAADFHSALSVPLTYEGYVYGVLTVYADEPAAFGDLEREVFAELGTNIANSINAVETRRALHADTLVELRLRLDSTDTFLGRVAREADCRIVYEGLATHTDSESRLFFRAVDASADAVNDVLADTVSVSDYRHIGEDEEGTLYEVTVTGETVPSRLVRHGATPRTMDVSAEETDVVVDIPTSTDVREFVEMLREAFPSVELVARRTVERSTQTRQELATSLFGGLTDRQLEVLRTAYFAGFFEWPRESTGEDVAEMLGVTQPTVNRHLRLAQSRLLEQLFDDAAPTVVAD